MTDEARHSLNSISNNPHFVNSSLNKEFSSEPLGFVDIGARGGVHEIVEPLAQHTGVLGFEPDDEECARLNSKRDQVENWNDFSLVAKALSDSNTKKTLINYRVATNDSLLGPNPEVTERYKMINWDVMGSGELNTTTLDDVIFSDVYRGKEYIGEFLKLDTQGSEFEILQGATRTLTERTVAIVCEVSFAEIYKDQKLFSEIELFLREFGFRFYGFETLYRRSLGLLDKKSFAGRERTVFTDAVFFKDPLVYQHSNSGDHDRTNKSLFLAALLLRFYDFALELSQKTWAKSDDSEAQTITALVKQLAGLPIDSTIEAIKALEQKVNKNPHLANMYAGDFVQRRKDICDYCDVLRVSSLPKEW